MTEAEIKVKEIASMSEFYALRDSLNLTDRQKVIFNYRYSRGWRMCDIAAELGYTEEALRDDMRDIRKKLAQVMRESIEQDLTL